jgi:hypothetical protein
LRYFDCTDSTVEIFYRVGGMDKVMALLTQKGEIIAVYLALEVVYSLCGASGASPPLLSWVFHFFSCD